MQFLHEKNIAGQTLLRLVARGNAIIAEILRLSANIPDPFRLANESTKRKYGAILIDYNYIEQEKGKGADHYESLIENDPQLLALNQEIKDTYLKKLRRFYSLFEVIYKYGNELKQYIMDIDNGFYIQQTLDGILLDENGKQLLCEALYLLGVMLLLLDLKIDGYIRERIVIAFMRFEGQSKLEEFDKVAHLVQFTGFSCANPPKKRLINYPESYFAKIQFPQNATSMIIGRLRSDDVFNQIRSYPLPEHRSTALSTQAQMLYVCLYFAPNILKSEEAAMREIVDKHFPDNWIITLYLGFTVDLTVEWINYPAAKAALDNTTQPKIYDSLFKKHGSRIPPVLQQLDVYLQEGTLDEEFILRNRSKLLEWLRAANVTLRWLMLHTRKSNPKTLELYCKGISQSEILLLLMKTSQFEFTLKNAIKGILEAQKEKFEESRKESVERVKELSEVFAGTKALTRVEKNDRLQNWFNKIASQIESLNFDEKTVTGRRIQQLIGALEEVALYHQIETNIPIKNWLAEIRGYLGKMIRLLNITDDVMATINLVSEIGYGRDIVYDYIEEMQERIKNDPGSVLLLRSTFLKLASMLQNPLARIAQVSGKETMAAEFVAVSQYYSSELINFVRSVLLIVPRMMFLKLDHIINIQTNQFIEMPMRFEKEEVEKYAQLNQRQKLAELTYQVSQFTEGILALETTLVGIIEIDPKKLLEEGIRKILVQSIAKQLDNALKFDSAIAEKSNVGEFHIKLEQLRRVLNGFRNSFNYLQDYMNIYGLKIWQEEFQRIINFNVEQECNMFMRKVFEGARSDYQNKIIPIPVFQPYNVKGDNSVNFIGRVAKQLLVHTDFTRTLYVHKMSTWYTREEKEIVGIKTFDLLIDSIGVFGVNGLNRYFGFSLVKELQNFIITVRNIYNRDKRFKQGLGSFVGNTQVKSVLINNPKFYDENINIVTSNENHPKIINIIASIGQKQLLRKHLANILGFKCKLDSNSLYCSLETLNKSLINEIQAHYRNPEKPYPGGPDSILTETSKYMENVGLNDPISKIYITVELIFDFASFLFLSVVKQILRFSFDAFLGNKPTKKGTSLIDDTVFAVGVVTILKQFHYSVTTEFLSLIGQYIKSLIAESLEQAQKGYYPAEAQKMLLFVDVLARFGNFPQDMISEHIPHYIRTDYPKQLIPINK